MDNNKTFKKLHLVKVPSEQLELGMHVAKLDRPWLETPFLLQGFPINKQEDLDALRTICEYVYIDVLKTHYITPEARTNVIAPGTPTTRYQTTTAVENEIRAASEAYRKNLEEIKTLLVQIGGGADSLHAKLVKQHVRECVDSIERNPSAMMWLTRIKHADQYTAEHCVNVGVLAMSLGRHLGVNRQQLEMLGLAGVLHDVGKMKLDQDILFKQGRLNDAEFQHVKQHTTFGKELLASDPLVPAEVIAAAYSHHERMDGRGYPERLPEQAIGFYARVVSIVDAYDAITSRRCYSAPRTSAQALKILYEHAGTHFDQKLVVKFIETIGIYPPGSVVEMDSGEVGVVLSADPENRLLPKIALLRDANKKPMLQRVIDLKLERATGTGVQHRIKAVLADGAYDIDLEDFTRYNINLPVMPSPPKPK
ncbi:MAG TPA: HD-GYP domain-containing protein [Dongiaceae bacterium]|nr:HD-GYP domain-containing protein [Dongiaceae bacterium]